MPFTPTHILAAVPIAYRWSSPGILTALATGSMIPDWPLYLPLGPGYQLTHSLTGIFIACLPLGLALVLLYGLWYRRADRQPAPEPVLSPLARWIWRSLLIGMPLAAIARHIYFMPQVSLRQVILALYYGVTEAGFTFIILVACYSLLFYPVVRYRLQSHS